ncbi:MAG: hypothetical protein IPL65_15775 [Lewinellaceae bacterium]|nr:hypothetical protein [Lewinellaceae bacterium]
MKQILHPKFLTSPLFYSFIVLGIVLVFGVIGCNKHELQNDAPVKGLMARDRTGTSIYDTLDMTTHDILSGFFALQTEQRTSRWGYNQVNSYANIDSFEYNNLLKIGRDAALIAGPEINMDRMLDFLIQKHSFSETVADFIKVENTALSILQNNNASEEQINEFVDHEIEILLAQEIDTCSLDEQKLIVLKFFKTIYGCLSTYGFPTLPSSEFGAAMDRDGPCDPDIIIAVALLGAVIGAFIGEKIAPQFANHPVSYTIVFVAGAFIGLAVWAAWCVAGTLLTWLGILDDQDPDCTLPNDYFVYYTDCNDYTVQLLNGGHNILNTHWVVTSNAALYRIQLLQG